MEKVYIVTYKGSNTHTIYERGICYAGTNREAAVSAFIEKLHLVLAYRLNTPTVVQMRNWWTQLVIEDKSKVDFQKPTLVIECWMGAIKMSSALDEIALEVVPLIKAACRDFGEIEFMDFHGTYNKVKAKR